MSKLARRTVKYCSLFLSILSLVFFYSLHAYDYLSLTHLSRPEILVVEGWLPESTLQKAKEEFLQNKYKLTLTTGFPFYKGFLMGSGGRMEFNTVGLQASPDSIYSVGLTIRGTKAGGKFAHFILFADTSRLCDYYSSRHKKQYTCRIKLASSPGTIGVEFDNDMFTRSADRNLYFYSVIVNGQIFPADIKNVGYYLYRNGKYILRQKLGSSTSTVAANYLKSLGIPDSLVVAIETQQKIKSKTYTTALDVKAWIAKNFSEEQPSINIFTQSIHARRSYVSYRKAFGNSADIGVISCPEKTANRLNWWKSMKGWKKILYETAGVLYTLIVL